MVYRKCGAGRQHLQEMCGGSKEESSSKRAESAEGQKKKKKFFWDVGIKQKWPASNRELCCKFTGSLAVPSLISERRAPSCPAWQFGLTRREELFTKMLQNGGFVPGTGSGRQLGRQVGLRKGKNNTSLSPSLMIHVVLEPTYSSRVNKTNLVDECWQ